MSSTQMLALEEAWDVLVVHEEWREWVRANFTPSFPFLYLAVREDVPKRRQRKTPSGASLQLPSAQLFRADAEGTLVDLFVGIIHDWYVRWADGRDYSAPPELPAALGPA